MEKLRVCQTIGIVLISYLLVANVQFIEAAERTVSGLYCVENVLDEMRLIDRNSVVRALVVE